MATRIHAAEKPVRHVFSDTYRFHIPHYQRPYAWTQEQAGEMLDDLLAAARCTHELDEADPYFLGSVVLVKKEDDPAADVVDGQQRLTTLMILLSLLRRHLPAQFSGPLDNRIFQQGDPIVGTKDQPRLSLKPSDQAFFEKYLLDGEGIGRIGEVATAELVDSQRCLIKNAQFFDARLAAISETDRLRLLKFTDQRTYLVIVETQDFDSAYRIFTVLNERGLDLTHSDILKSELIGKVPSAVQDAYTFTWESIEEELGRRDFADLFAYVRMVYAKTKAREAILKEFRAAVMSKVNDPCRLISDVLKPYSDAFITVSRSSYQEEPGADDVNEVLRSLNLLDNVDWIPPAISYLTRHGSHPGRVLTFLRDLDRLAASMHVRRLDVTQRIERHGRVLAAIENGEDLSAAECPLQLSQSEQAKTLELLDGEIYVVTRLRAYVLLRLDSALSAGGANYDHPIITVEHVLPQNPRPGSTWREVFTDDERAYWVHRLANLVLLPKRKNSEAGNREFEAKKQGYFTGTRGVVPFQLTSQVIRELEWTPAVLERRQTALLGMLKTLWRLES